MGEFPRRKSRLWAAGLVAVLACMSVAAATLFVPSLQPPPSPSAQSAPKSDGGQSAQRTAPEVNSATDPAATSPTAPHQPKQEHAPAEQASNVAQPARAKNSEPKLTSTLSTLASGQLDGQSNATQAKELGAPVSGPGSIFRTPSGGVRVEIIVNNVDGATTASLERSGARILAKAPAFDTYTANVALDEISPVAAMRSVQAMNEVREPMKYSAGGAVTQGVSQGCNPLASEANSQLRAALANSTYGVDGTGVTIGVLSDSYSNQSSPTSAANDVTAGALPGTGNPCGRTTPVSVLQDNPSGASDEGRAMLQLVHSVAPKATLKFATAWISESSFATNILALRDAGANVIVDDIIWLNEPMFQGGPISSAISNVKATGVSYFSAAGNDNNTVGGANVSSWETPAYRPMACPASVAAVWNPAADSCMDFSGSGDNTASFTIKNGSAATLVLNYGEPAYALSSDFDIYLLDHSSGAILDQGASVNATASRPFEYLQYTPPGGSGTTQVDVVVSRYSGTGTPRAKFLFMQTTISAAEFANPPAGDIVGPAIFGHNGSPDAISVGATKYNATTAPEAFSSAGPETWYFTPVNGTNATTALGSPVVTNAPDFTATDGDCTTFFGSTTGTTPGSCPRRFYGTSAAAPNAAAVAALIKQAAPSTTPAQMRTIMRNTAAAQDPTYATRVGAGLVDAQAAVQSIWSGSSPGTPTTPTTPTTNPATTPTTTATAPFGARASVKASRGKAVVTFSAGGNATQYRYRYALKSAIKKAKWKSSGAKATLRGIARGKRYVIQIVAVNSAGSSAQSSTSFTGK